jgi:hypothetical protein
VRLEEEEEEEEEEEDLFVFNDTKEGPRAVFPGSSRLGIEPKTPGATTRPIGDLIPNIRYFGTSVDFSSG